MVTTCFAGVLTVLAWLFIFLVGLTINSAPFRDGIAHGQITMLNLGMAFIAYTVTNAAILCLLSGVAGAISRTLPLTSASDAATPPGSVHSPRQGIGEIIFAGMLRSFVVYLLFASGVYIAASDAFANTTPEQYGRVVASTSLLAFVVSYKPTVFGRVLGWFAPTPLGAQQGDRSSSGALSEGSRSGVGGGQRDPR